MPEDPQARLDHVHDSLPRTGNELGRAFRDMAAEEKVLELARRTESARSSAASFRPGRAGIRLPRTAPPWSPWASPAAPTATQGKITRRGSFVERLETDPGRFIPASERLVKAEGIVQVDLNRPMAEIQAELTKIR